MPADEHDEVEITGSSEPTSKLMGERIVEEEKKKAEIKIEPQVMELDNPLNRPLKIILPEGNTPLDVPPLAWIPPH